MQDLSEEVKELRRQLKAEAALHEQEQQRFEQRLEAYDKKRERWRESFQQMRGEILKCVICAQN